MVVAFYRSTDVKSIVCGMVQNLRMSSLDLQERHLAPSGGATCVAGFLRLHRREAAPWAVCRGQKSQINDRKPIP